MYTGQISKSSFTTYAELLADVMTMKYSFLRYTVSSFEYIHQMGGVYYSPLFYHYPNDQLSYQDITKNIMLGDALKFSFDPEVQKYGDDAPE